jgi:hypothetical protein
MKKEARRAAETTKSATAEAVPDAKRVGERLVELCRAGKNFDAIDELYDGDIVSVENMAPPEMPLTMMGVDAIRGKNKWWFDNNQVHAAAADGPLVNGDRFAVHYRYEFTPRQGTRRASARRWRRSPSTRCATARSSTKRSSGEAGPAGRPGAPDTAVPALRTA